eukprot:TRINITY_DN71262_c0_g1_i1.p5 TRINITY_DN71262_c0_g1~~TRINITY_DN71262_c0_g1_i1.p5  ORF type:complete len:139 (+),score=8.47 TRINITY_DN71262_c0_g1_i1:345-761(+)
MDFLGVEGIPSFEVDMDNCWPTCWPTVPFGTISTVLQFVVLPSVGFCKNFSKESKAIKTPVTLSKVLRANAVRIICSTASPESLCSVSFSLGFSKTDQAASQTSSFDIRSKIPSPIVCSMMIISKENENTAQEDEVVL